MDAKIANALTLHFQQTGGYNGAIDVNGQTLTIDSFALNPFNGPINGSGTILVSGDADLRVGGNFSGDILGSVNVGGSMPNANIQPGGSGFSGFDGQMLTGSGTVGTVNVPTIVPGRHQSPGRRPAYVRCHSHEIADAHACAMDRSESGRHVGSSPGHRHCKHYRCHVSPEPAQFVERISPALISADDVVVSEGNSGRSTATVHLHLNTAATQPVRVAWKTADGTANSGEDYQQASGVLDFAPGETAHDILLTIFGDTKLEGDETFSVQLIDPINASVSRDHVTVVIKNDDATFTQRSLTYATRSSGVLTLDLYTPVVNAPLYPVVVWVPGLVSYDSDTSVIPALRDDRRTEPMRACEDCVMPLRLP